MLQGTCKSPRKEKEMDGKECSHMLKKYRK